MRTWTTVLAGVFALAMLVDVMAVEPPEEGEQPPQWRGGPPGGEFRGPGQRGGRPGGMQGQGPGRAVGRMRPMRSPLMMALDIDKDGEISAKEIKKATKSLKKLDKNEDGKLDREEMCPRFPVGVARGRGFQGPGGQQPGGWGPGGRGPGGQGFRSPRSGGPRAGGPGGQGWRGPIGECPWQTPEPEGPKPEDAEQ